MDILLLSPYPERLRPIFEACRDRVSVTTEPIVEAQDDLSRFEWIVSYGYRHILRPPLLSRFPRRAINLHISFLPFNRGAHPNYWSWADRTPSGVTIHEIDEGIDTGPIIAQRMVCMARTRTFADTYAQLLREIEQLFAVTWPEIRTGNFESFPQIGQGTFHYARELPNWPKGWDARICDAFNAIAPAV